MPKPICLIKVDLRNCSSSCIEQMRKEAIGQLDDYHVVTVPFEQPDNEPLEPIQLQVFYEKDFTEIQYEELKKIIEDCIKNKKE